MKNSGFTLLEVLLALTIFSIIALATSQQINVIRNTKETALGQIEQLTGVRSALAVIRDDLSQAFHIRYNDLGPFLRPRVEKGEAVPHTLFDGRKNQLIFTSLSHRNYYAGRKDSEQTEISYFLENQKGTDKNTLFKRESPLIDGNLFDGGTVYTLLENVTRLEFQFWDDKLSKWGDDWNSDAGSSRDIFPRAVKILVSAWDEKQKREITAETSFKVAFPNNQDRWVIF